jgi:hypothetical protein
LEIAKEKANQKFVDILDDAVEEYNCLTLEEKLVFSTFINYYSIIVDTVFGKT